MNFQIFFFVTDFSFYSAVVIEHTQYDLNIFTLMERSFVSSLENVPRCLRKKVFRHAVDNAALAFCFLLVQSLKVNERSELWGLLRSFLSTRTENFGKLTCLRVHSGKCWAKVHSTTEKPICAFLNTFAVINHATDTCHIKYGLKKGTWSPSA